MQDEKLTGYPSIDKPWLKYYSEEAINAYPPECCIYDYIYKKNENNMSNYAINYCGKKFTYRKMFERIDETAKAFLNIGIKQGDIVSLCMLTMPETIYTIYALNRLGAIPNIIEPRTNSDNIKKRIIDTNSNVLVVADVFIDKIKKIYKDSSLKKVIVVPVSYSMPIYKKMYLKLFKANLIAKTPNEKCFIEWSSFFDNIGNIKLYKPYYKKDTPAVIIYTGGTTGGGKGAVLSNDSFTSMATQVLMGAPKLFSGKIFLEIMPPFIAYGLVFGHFLPFCAKLENCLIPIFKPEKFADYVLKNKPNHVVGVPTFFESLADSKRLKNKNISYLSSCIAGGDRMLINSEEHINTVYKQHGCINHITKGYGMTEMGSAATFTVTDKCNLPGSVGVPCPFVNIKVINPDSGEELPYNQRGEICMTSPTMMLQYFNNAEETNKVMKMHEDGKTWIHTGDIGYITEDGVVFIVDRIKRMIIRPDGHNVFPSLIEEVLSKHPSVENCAVVGIENSDNKSGQIPTAFIQLKNNTTKNGRVLIDLELYCKEHLPERDTPMRYNLIDKIPLTSIGKIDYLALEKQAKEMISK